MKNFFEDNPTAYFYLAAVLLLVLAFLCNVAAAFAQVWSSS